MTRRDTLATRLASAFVGKWRLRKGRETKARPRRARVAAKPLQRALVPRWLASGVRRDRLDGARVAARLGAAWGVPLGCCAGNEKAGSGPENKPLPARRQLNLNRTKAI